MQQRLGRDAADVEAGAAEGGALLDAGHLQAELGGADGADIAAGAGADDDDVEAVRLMASQTPAAGGADPRRLPSPAPGSHRLAAVDDAVVVGRAPGTSSAGSRPGRRPPPGAPGSRACRGCRLRRVEDRRGQQRAEDAAVGDGERAAGQVVELELRRRGRAWPNSAMALLDLGEAQPVGVADDRHHQAASRPPTAMPMWTKCL